MKRAFERVKDGSDLIPVWWPSENTGGGMKGN